MGFFDSLNSQLRDLTIKAAGANEHLQKIKEKVEPIKETQKEYQKLKSTVKLQAIQAKKDITKIVKLED